MKQLLIAVTGFCALTYTEAIADSTKNPFGPWYLQGYTQKPWHFELHAGASVLPDFAGASQHELGIELIPRIFFFDKWQNRYRIGFDGAEATFDLAQTTAISLFMKPDKYSLFEPDAQIEGLDDSVDSWVGGLQLAQRLGDAYLFASIKAGAGVSYDAGIGYDWQITERWSLRPSIALSGAGNEKMDNHFDVTASEAEASGLSEYDPDAGLRSLSIDIQSEYELNRHFSLFFRAGLENYIGEAGDSPIIKSDKGSDVTLRGFAGIIYRW